MSHIRIVYNNRGKAEFDFKNVTDEQIFTALLGIESYIGAKSQLPVSEIRSILDELKQDKVVKSND